MANINLSTNQAGSYSNNKKPTSSSIGMLFGLALLLIAVIMAAVLVVREKSLADEISQAEAEYATVRDSLTAGRNMDVIDLQSRIFKLKELTGQRNETLDAIANVEKYLATGVVVKNFDFDKEEKKISLDCIAGDMNMVSKQVASLKSLQYFSSVTLGDVKASETGGGIEFNVDILNK